MTVKQVVLCLALFQLARICVFVIHTACPESSSKCIYGAASPPAGTEATVSSGIWPQQLLFACRCQLAVIRAQVVWWTWPGPIWRTAHDIIIEAVWKVLLPHISLPMLLSRYDFAHASPAELSQNCNFICLLFATFEQHISWQDYDDMFIHSSRNESTIAR